MFWLGWAPSTTGPRTREAGRDPQFDKLLKEACSGWFYKPKQTDETKDQFPEWYRTRVEDREYELDMHVGKGTSFDPQNTIRIGFDWDEEEKRVVVGVYRAAPEESAVLGGKGAGPEAEAITNRAIARVVPIWDG